MLSIKIRSKGAVSSISIFEDGDHIKGLRIEDENNDYLVNECWSAGNGRWVMQKVPKGSEIIGIACNIKSFKSHVPHLAFLLWCPKVIYDESFQPQPSRRARRTSNKRKLKKRVSFSPSTKDN